MNTNELMNRLNEIEDTRQELNNLVEFFRKCATFNSEDISNILAKLATEVSGEEYVPVNNYDHYIEYRSDFYAFTSRIVKTKINRDIKSVEDIKRGVYVDNIRLGEKYVECTNQEISEWCKNNRNGFDITFKFPWNKLDKNISILNEIEFGANDKLNEEYSPKYIIDFIEYLFELQAMNNGERIDYSRMEKAMEDFLAKNNTKKLVKQK
ncbi:MAG: hypothetical protein IKI04_03035 [Bacilli bacterium]|nr:hypothetical protein [Bacilli bacterium]